MRVSRASRALRQWRGLTCIDTWRCALADSSVFWASGGAKFPEMGDSLIRMPMNHHAKFDAASFILAEDIRNRTNTHKQTNSRPKRYLHLAYWHVWIANKYAGLRGRTYIHTCDSTSTRRAILRRRISTVMFMCGWTCPSPPRAGRFVRLWAPGEAKFLKTGDSLPWTQMNHRAKYDAASFILGGEIRANNTLSHTQTNSNRYIHTLPIGMYG